MLKEYLTSIADSIRAKLDTTEKINAQDYADKISEVYDVGYAKGAEENSGGGAELARSIVDGTITEYVDNEITAIAKYALHYRDKLITVSAANVVTIGNYAFYGCSSLVNVYLPKVTTISDQAFNGCKMLTEIPNSSTLTSIGSYSFYGCYRITDIYLPNAKSISSCTFQNMAANSGGKYIGLTTVKLPLVTSIPMQMCANCYALTTVDIGVATYINSSAFSYCQTLTSLIIRRDSSICSVQNTAVFSNSGIANGTGYIYVPSALIDTYKSATNWSTYATQFRVLEDYTVDGTITGELDESKI